MIRFVSLSTATIAAATLFSYHSRLVAQTPQIVKANVNAPAVITVSNKIIRPKNKVMPLGANNFGAAGPVDFMANNFISNWANEPMSARRLFRVAKSFGNSAELDRGGVSGFDLTRSGYMSGARVRVYRLVDKNGKSLPQKDDNPNSTYVDLDKAAGIKLVRSGRLLPEGAPGFPDGGWVANKYTNVASLGPLRSNLKHTDFLFQKPNRAYHYVVVAVDANGNESEYSNEASARPRATGNTSPRIVVTNNDEARVREGVKANEGFGSWGGGFTLRALGGKAPLKWELLGRNNKPMSLPEGMKFNVDDPANVDSSRFKLSVAKLEGGLKEEPKNFFFRVRVTDAMGKSDTRDYVANPPADVKDDKDKEKPAPPRSVTVVANTNSVTLAWQPSTSPDVVGYRVLRSEVPAAQQEERVHLEGAGVPLEKDDYLFFERVFTKVDPSYTSPRVGFEPGLMGYFWTSWSASGGVIQEQVMHDKSLAKKVVDGGESCLKLTSGEGTHNIIQNVFTGVNGNANDWYTQFEPGKKYRMEVWMRGENLGNDGKVVFDYNNDVPGYKDITKTMNVTKDWQKFTLDFVGPARPDKNGIFGHRFNWTGAKSDTSSTRSTLWMDNARIFRYDTPADLNKNFVPNATILKEINSALPKGAKGSWRAYDCAMNQATMDSLLSYQPSSAYSIDWATSVQSSTSMTLPMVMDVFLKTGKTPSTRVHPFLTLQIYFSEKEWRDFIEYLAAPYDPKKDTPKTKPYAYRRTQQRDGILTPWTDEFPEITIEFGNETWHNGTRFGWEGMGRSYVSWAPDEGREMGYFTRYLAQNMTSSPYWKSQNLGKKIQFDLGGFYNGNVEKDGTVTGYAENARKVNPLISQIGHATYVGPKWETGAAPLKVFNDEGVLRTLISYVADSQELWTNQSNAQKKMAAMGMPYDITAYEGGPSGYIINGQDPDANKATEMYGKSLAMGVAALDGWLDATRLGWTYQNFLNFSQGGGWSSHTLMGKGYRPYPGWLALKMRNQFGVGEMISTDVKGPSFNRKQGAKTTNIPLIGGYSFRDGNKYGVFVLSRKLNGTILETNFGKGTTKTAIKLPFTNAKKITLLKLTGNPRATNIDAYNIKLKTQNIPVSTLEDQQLVIDPSTGGVAGGMPMGSAFLYIFEGTS